MDVYSLIASRFSCFDDPLSFGLFKCLLSGLSIADAGVLLTIFVAVVAVIVAIWKAIIAGHKKAKDRKELRIADADVIISPKIETENPDIVGREKDVDKLLKLFDAGNPVVAIHAQGGVGKTALADEYARRQAASGRYGGVWRIAATSASDAANDIRPLAAKLNVPNSDQPDMLIPVVMDAMVASGKNWLLIHDNVDDPDMQRGLINRLLHKDKIDHLITGRMGNWNNIAEPYSLEELSNKEAAKLLARESNRKSNAKLKKLAVDTLGRLPLALVVAGADLRSMPSISVEQYSEGFEKRLKEAPAGKTYEKSVYAAVTGSLELLDENARALLKLAAYM